MLPPLIAPGLHVILHAVLLKCEHGHDVGIRKKHVFFYLYRYVALCTLFRWNSS